MDIQTSPDPVARARELGAEIAAAADEIERMRRIPAALLGRLHDSRLFRMLLPRSASGDETEPAVYVAAIEELARHDGSIAIRVRIEPECLTGCRSSVRSRTDQKARHHHPFDHSYSTC